MKTNSSETRELFKKCLGIYKKYGTIEDIFYLEEVFSIRNLEPEKQAQLALAVISKSLPATLLLAALAKDLNRTKAIFSELNDLSTKHLMVNIIQEDVFGKTLKNYTDIAKGEEVVARIRCINALNSCYDNNKYRKEISDKLLTGDVNFTLRIVSRLGLTAVVKVMLKWDTQLKLDINSCGDSGKNAWDYAQENKQTATVALLKEHMNIKEDDPDSNQTIYNFSPY